MELTETSAVSDLQDAERFIEALRKTGCGTCLDDFGTGFASFSYLKLHGSMRRIASAGDHLHCRDWLAIRYRPRNSA